MAADGQGGVVEAEPQRPLLGQGPGDVVEELPPAAPLLEAVDLLGGTLDVPEVGHEGTRAVRPGADHGEAVGSGEPGDVAQVDRLGHEQGVELARGDRGGQPLGPRIAHPAGASRRARSVSRASRYPSTPLPDTLATHTSRITDTPRQSSRPWTSDRWTSTAGRPVSSSASWIDQA